ncbi:MAG: hypothetical protein POELPBGB_02843 [Bacteroidia bacterium]|nr:hypothetical protein [Bacteroidia bacterium]
MVLRFISWLKQYKVLNVLLVFVYGSALIFFHDYFVYLSVDIMNSLSLPVYNKVVLVISICLGVSILASLLYVLYKSKENRNGKLFFLLLTTLLIALHYKFLFEMNIEVIHVFEFTLLSVLLFPLLGSFGASVAFTLPFILVNEWYQYVVLYPGYIQYFEFNDIVIDLLGCGMAMHFLWIAGITPRQNSPLWRKPEFVFLLGFNLLFILLFAACVVVFYPADKCNNTFLVLNQLKNPHLFWQTHVYGAVYHVMKPLEGLVAVNGVCLLFALMDFVAKK